MKYCISIFLFLITTVSYSQDLDILNIVTKQLKLDKSKIKEDLFVYKTIPNNKAETIVVIPEIVDEDEEGYWFELNSYILIIDTKTGKIKNKYFESSKTNNWTSDAVVLTKISIDTAPYQVSEKIRAFGVRVHYYGMSKPNPYSSTTISLFIKSKNSLNKVLKNYTIMDYGGEWDTNCTGKFIDEKKTLIISSNKTNNFYDITVKNKITITESFEDKNGECNYKEKKTSKKTILKFNNREYKENAL